MPNRRRYRRVAMFPPMEGFKIFGIPMRELESVHLLFEGFEAIRLADYENLTQEEARPHGKDMGMCRKEGTTSDKGKNTT